MRRNLTRRGVLLRGAALSAGAILTGRTAIAIPYPTRPIRLLVGSAAGSVPDMVSRLIADKLSSSLGQAVIIENRPGAGGVIAMQSLISSAPDGYTLALATMSQLVFNSYLFSKLTYDPLNDLEPICPMVTGAMAIGAYPGVEANTLSEFIALAKAQPGKLSIGTAANGSPPDLVARLLIRATEIDVVLIPFRIAPEGVTAAMRGDIQAFIDAPPMIAPQVKAGDLKVLAVTGRTREPELPGIQTTAEAGFPDLRGEAWIGLVVPRRTPTELVARLNHEIATILAAQDVQRQLAVLSFRPFVQSVDEFKKLIADEHRYWGPLIKATGIHLD